MLCITASPNEIVAFDSRETGANFTLEWRNGRLVLNVPLLQENDSLCISFGGEMVTIVPNPGRRPGLGIGIAAPPTINVQRKRKFRRSD